MNRYGAPPLRGKEFIEYRSNVNNETIVGAAMTVRMPTGNYEEDKLLNDNTLEQNTLYIVYAHLIHTFRPGQWASISGGYDYGGENRLNGVDQDDTKQNIGWKLSYAHPINRSLGLMVTYLGTRTQESTGSDTDTLAVNMSFVW